VGLTCASLIVARQARVSYKEQHVLADTMVECRLSTELNREMWQGLNIFCKKAQSMLNDLPDHNSEDRRPKWHANIHKFGHILLMQAQAIDIFIICLEECGYIPTNLNVAALLGDDRYHLIKGRMQNAADNLKEQEMKRRIALPSQALCRALLGASGDE
jgi:hypothetical protein